jgi:hypothetical protein
MSNLYGIISSADAYKVIYLINRDGDRYHVQERLPRDEFVSSILAFHNVPEFYKL